MDAKELGAWGENYAAMYLERKGYNIVTKNYHAQGGEIDLITRDGSGFWVLFEVKTRRTDRFGFGEEAVTALKIRKMQRAAVRFFLYDQKLRTIPDYEIQVILIYPQRGKWFIEVIDNLGF